MKNSPYFFKYALIYKLIQVHFVSTYRLFNKELNHMKQIIYNLTFFFFLNKKVKLNLIIWMVCDKRDFIYFSLSSFVLLLLIMIRAWITKKNYVYRVQYKTIENSNESFHFISFSAYYTFGANGGIFDSHQYVYPHLSISLYTEWFMSTRNIWIHSFHFHS